MPDLKSSLALLGTSSPRGRPCGHGQVAQRELETLSASSCKLDTIHFILWRSLIAAGMLQLDSREVAGARQASSDSAGDC